MHFGIETLVVLLLVEISILLVRSYGPEGLSWVRKLAIEFVIFVIMLWAFRLLLDARIVVLC